MVNKQTKRNAEPSKGRLRVAHVMFSLEPGGLENGVVNISNQLEPENFESLIICLDRVGDFSERLNDNVEVLCLEKPPKFSFITVWKLSRLLRAHRPDVIHTHNLGPLLYVFLGRLVGGCHIPILHGEHAELQGNDLGKKQFLMRKILFKFVDRVHTVSGALKEQLSELKLLGKPAKAILNGVDSTRFAPAGNVGAARRAVDVPENTDVIGVVGRFASSKRHLLMLEAFVKIASTQDTSVLLIVGDTGDAREAILEAIESHQFRDRIIWAGYQSDPAPWYQVMDVLAMPSINEGLSNALLEAMSSGVPCLAHPACGASEVIEDGVDGRLVSVDTAEQLANAVISMIEDRESLMEMGRQARSTIMKRFSLTRMIENYSLLYKEVGAK